ncbi:tRNA 5-methoxyuridine(34)/uridine 5-oxyacetic acid(34) synthase CmoB [Granulosicoccaceae sp. 1_MG-2023]|nr:tRNA 5-methoxyuridine(34)/uridine 5-oxyacetic acid(34) synthase CmoB [Granulosicoccaceae sp. 1_MG-2023]
MIDTDALQAALLNDPEPAAFAETLVSRIRARLDEPNHGDLQRWLDALAALPAAPLQALRYDGGAVTVGHADSLSAAAQERLLGALRGLMPWRKGPYQVFGTDIDTEWRSDWKWDRVQPHISDLSGRRVLDIGCGNGYHLWRMHEAGARQVIGVDPSLLFACQFAAINRYAGRRDVHFVPLGMEALPQDTGWFDTVFSMGVLYHRRSPMDYLRELAGQLRRGGELVLETLVIEGDEQHVLVPQGRYARMRNVWFIPSSRALVLWLQRNGFCDVRIVDECTTTTDEQRTTDWMQYESLAQCLDPDDPTRTVEGHPAPKRAVLVGTRR